MLSEASTATWNQLTREGVCHTPQDSTLVPVFLSHVSLIQTLGSYLGDTSTGGLRRGMTSISQETVTHLGQNTGSFTVAM